MLDASMTHHPGATLHHHTPVVSLKQTCAAGLTAWCLTLMGPPYLYTWTVIKATISSRRKQWQKERFKLSQAEIVLKAKRQKKKGKKPVAPSINLPDPKLTINKDEWVAVAYQDIGWFTGKYVYYSASTNYHHTPVIMMYLITVGLVILGVMLESLRRDLQQQMDDLQME